MAYAQPAAIIATPVGPVRIVEGEDALISITIRPTESSESAADTPLLREAAAQLLAYFDGRLARFDLPLAPLRSPRGEALRAAICDIGYGETLSYGALARVAGSAPRAIGQACARNPFPIVVPCHRVTGAGGALGHYSGGEGVKTKAWLLNHEARDRLI